MLLATTKDSELPKANVNLKRSSVLDYFSAELTRSYALELEEERYAARREKVIK